jgi:rhodanese-related sulfurtransferase
MEILNRLLKALLAAFLLGATLTPLAAEDHAPLRWTVVKQTIRLRFPAVPQLTTTDLAAWLADSTRTPPLLLDTRSPEEYAVSHLHQAHRAASEQEAHVLLDSLATDQPLVLYCSVGYRSSALVKKLKKRGYTKIYNLEGSLFEWANAGHPMYQGETQVYSVHPYDKKWGQLLAPTLHAKLNR